MGTVWTPPEITRSGLRHALTRKPKKRSFLIRPKDVFGRKYTVWMDKNAEPPAPVGLISRTFSEPRECVIPDKYLSIPIVDETPIYSRMRIDFDGYITELQDAMALWKKDADQWMRKLYREMGVQRAARGDYSEDVLELAGPMPTDWRLIELAKRGDPWCLGFQSQRTPGVIEILGEAPVMRKPRRTRSGATRDMGERMESLAAQYLKDHAQDFAEDLDEEEQRGMEAAWDRKERETLGIGDDDGSGELDGDELEDLDEEGDEYDRAARAEVEKIAPDPAQPVRQKPRGRVNPPRDPKTGRLVKSEVRSG